MTATLSHLDNYAENGAVIWQRSYMECLYWTNRYDDGKDSGNRAKTIKIIKPYKDNDIFRKIGMRRRSVL